MSRSPDRVQDAEAGQTELLRIAVRVLATVGRRHRRNELVLGHGTSGRCAVDGIKSDPLETQRGDQLAKRSLAELHPFLTRPEHRGQPAPAGEGYCSGFTQRRTEQPQHHPTAGTVRPRPNGNKPPFGRVRFFVIRSTFRSHVFDVRHVHRARGTGLYETLIVITDTWPPPARPGRTGVVGTASTSWDAGIFGD